MIFLPAPLALPHQHLNGVSELVSRTIRVSIVCISKFNNSPKIHKNPDPAFRPACRGLAPEHAVTLEWVEN